ADQRLRARIRRSASRRARGVGGDRSSGARGDAGARVAAQVERHANKCTPARALARRAHPRGPDWIRVHRRRDRGAPRRGRDHVISYGAVTPPKPRVLIVDDQPEVLRVYARALEIDGCDTQTAASAQAAMDLINASPPDAIL